MDIVGLKKEIQVGNETIQDKVPRGGRGSGRKEGEGEGEMDIVGLKKEIQVGDETIQDMVSWGGRG